MRRRCGGGALAGSALFSSSIEVTTMAEPTPKEPQLALRGLRFFSTSASVIIIISGSTGHS